MSFTGSMQVTSVLGNAGAALMCDSPCSRLRDGISFYSRMPSGAISSLAYGQTPSLHRYRKALRSRMQNPDAKIVRMTQATIDTLTITRPDDWHLHVRNGAVVAAIVPH